MATFDGKVALVTGGGSGIGEATAMLLADRGASVVVTDIHLDTARRVAEAIGVRGGAAAAFAANVADPEDSKASVDFAVATYGALHLAVNNAGIGGTLGPVGDLSPDDWATVIGVNLNGVLSDSGDAGRRRRLDRQYVVHPGAGRRAGRAGVHGRETRGDRIDEVGGHCLLEPGGAGELGAPGVHRNPDDREDRCTSARSAPSHRAPGATG